MKDQNIWKYGFNWGSIIGAGIFLTRILGHYFGGEGGIFWPFLASIVFIFGTAWMINNYGRNIIKEKMKFSRMLLLGFISSLVVSFFHVLYMIVYINKLNPGFFNEMLAQYEKLGINIDVYSDTNIANAIEFAMYPATYVIELISNTFYILMIAGIITLQNRPNYRGSNPNIPPRSDYTPYTTTTPPKYVAKPEEDSQEDNNEGIEEAEDDGNAFENEDKE